MAPQEQLDRRQPGFSCLGHLFARRSRQRNGRYLCSDMMKLVCGSRKPERNCPYSKVRARAYDSGQPQIWLVPRLDTAAMTLRPTALPHLAYLRSPPGTRTRKRR